MLKERIKTLTTEAILSQLDVRFNIWKILKILAQSVTSLYLSEEFELNRFGKTDRHRTCLNFYFKDWY